MRIRQLQPIFARFNQAYLLKKSILTVNCTHEAYLFLTSLYKANLISYFSIVPAPIFPRQKLVRIGLKYTTNGRPLFFIRQILKKTRLNINTPTSGNSQLFPLICVRQPTSYNIISILEIQKRPLNLCCYFVPTQF
jgi:ribosomal protein S8